MNKVKDIIMVGILIFIFVGSIIYNAYEMDKHGLEIAKDKIANAKRVVIALHEFKKYDVDKEFVYNYKGQKYEVIKDITNQEELERIKNTVLKANTSKSEIQLSWESAMLIQFYDESNKKVAEYDLRNIAIGYNTRSLEVEIPLEDYALLYQYFKDYNDLMQEYFVN